MTMPIFAAAFRRLWTKLAMRSGEYDGTDPARFDRLHLVEDPYKLGSSRELRRFELTNALIAKACPDIANILEVGSGEGMQTRYLAALCPHVIGIEVSARAAARARERMPDVEFLVGPGEDVLTLVGDRPVDLAVVCEILYLTPNAGQIIADLQRIADRIFVTNYYKRAPTVAQHLTGSGWQRLDNFTAEGMTWWCYVWNKPADA